MLKKNFFGNRKVDDDRKLAKELLMNLQASGCEMSIKVHYFCSYSECMEILDMSAKYEGLARLSGHKIDGKTIPMPKARWNYNVGKRSADV